MMERVEHERTPATGREVEAALRALVGLNESVLAVETLRPRLEQVGRYGLYKAAMKQIENGITETLRTMDEAQCKQVLRGLKNKVVKLVPRPVMGENADYSDVTIPGEVLLALANSAVDNQCVMCPYDGDLNGMRACEVRRAFLLAPFEMGRMTLKMPCWAALEEARQRKAVKKKRGGKR